jgi:SAM-dependent methyltransferase
MNLLLFPLAIIESIPKDARILVVGPRNENDLYTLSGLGFRFRNLVGLDLISYSPYVKLGDMHAIPFADGAFDAVVCGWTLSYSTEPQRAADELMRVTKPGGVIAIGVEYSTLTRDDELKMFGYSLQEPGAARRLVNSTADIKALFKSRLRTVFFEHDAPNRRSHTVEKGIDAHVSNVALVFDISGAAPHA